MNGGIDSSEAADAVRQEALRFIARARYESAFPLYERLIFEFNDRSPDVVCEAGFVCWRLGLIDEAEESFRRTLQSEPTHLASLINVVDMRLSLGIVKPDTDDLMKRLLHNHPQNAEVRLLVAKQAFFEGRKDKGRDIAVKIGREMATNQVAQLLACKLLLEYGCYLEAIKLAEENLKRGDTHPHFYDFAAKAHVSLNQFEQAAELYRLVAERYPDRLMPHYGLAYVKFGQADFADAKEILEEVLEKSPEHAEANRLYWFTLVALKEWEALVRVTGRYLDNDPPPLLPLHFHIAALGQLGRRTEIENLFQKYGERAKHPLPLEPVRNFAYEAYRGD